MKVTIRDESVLRSIRPHELVTYLRSRGFRQHEAPGAVTATWRKGSGSDEFEILVPLEPTFRDYASRVLDVLKTLEALEQRSQLDILRDIVTSTADMVRIPARRVDMRDGSISITNGVDFYQSARELMLAAACAAIEPRSNYATKRSAQATRYLEHARFGQTEHSSYVLTILSPVPPKLSTHGLGDPDDVEEPYERQVTVTLIRALASARAAAERASATGNLDHFQQAVASGVSANLCEALVGLSASGGDPTIDLEVSISWAPARPGPTDLPRVVRMPAGAMPVFGETARIFRATSPAPEFELRGYVSHLDRPESATEGTVTIRGFVEERPRTVEVRLREPEYGLAVRAHAERLSVFCIGELRKRGNMFVLENPRQFMLESTGE
jgi:hypothetical protein